MMASRASSLCLLLGMLAPATPSAASLGAVLSYQKTGHGIAGRTATAEFSVDVYSPHIMRVRVTPQGSERHVGYALTTDEVPAFSQFSVDAADPVVVVKTSSITAQVELRPDLRITFKDADGTVINEDLPGKELGMTLTGTKITVYKRLQSDERFIGMGEQLGNLDRRGTVVTLKNTDNYRYDDPKVPMYVSIPFFMGLHHGKAYGLFFNNSYRSVFNFGASNRRFASYSFDGGALDEFFMFDASVGKILEHYTSLTGRMPLPPRWSLGYQQSRCSYYPQAQVMFIANTFRTKRIPLDGIVLDADYLHQYQPFRINRERFPDLRRLADTLRGMNIELTASVNPGIAIDDSYAQYKSGLEDNVFLRYADGELWIADIAPNTNHFVDFSDPRGRRWWIDQMKVYQDLGIRGLWNDMNEPAIDGQAMPDNVLFDFDGQKTSALEAQNYYGMLMARAAFESAVQYGGNRRPFVLSRAGFAGIQRYAAVWSGDNQAKDEHILLGALLINQMGLSGVPFTGPDLGGYIGDGNKDLYRRWVEVGVFAPYLRNHRGPYTAANEPWAYGEEAEAISKAYIGFRYELMPYLYSTFYEAAQTGMPVSRSLSIDSPFDANVFKPDFQYEFLFGPALLVNPMTSKEQAKSTYLPIGEWYDLFTDERLAGGRVFTADYAGHRIPIFAKASAIVPMQGKVQSTRDDPGPVLYVHVFNGSERNEFVYYDDDGATLDYRKGKFRRRVFTFDPAARQLSFSRPEGNYAARFRRIQVILHGFESVAGATVNGVATAVQPRIVRMLDPLEALSDVYWDKQTLDRLRQMEPMKPQATLEFDDAAQVVVRWR
ncbi:MAG TPA: TIM-barrel domain-containing protein [Steroidobacteraceae bacterium]|nr:TIM-barrel domain-containing protein [Steroidobacteraceae bacterium]